jgi:hypothetical protein
MNREDVDAVEQLGLSGGEEGRGEGGEKGGEGKGKIARRLNRADILLASKQRFFFSMMATCARQRFMHIFYVFDSDACDLL